jgi:hypothetical protein
VTLPNTAISLFPWEGREEDKKRIQKGKATCTQPLGSSVAGDLEGKISSM